MSTFTKRLRGLFLPFFIAGIGLAAAYALVRWQIDVQTRELNVAYNWANFVVPGVLCLLLAVVVMYKRTNVIYFNGKNPRTSRFFTMLLPGIFLIPALVTTQLYLDDVFFPVTHVATPANINPATQSVFFVIDSFRASPRDAFITWSYGSRSKSGYYTAYVYFSIPLYGPDTAKDTAYTTGATPVAWCAQLFHTSVKGSLAESDQYLQTYIDRCKAWVDTIDFTRASCFRNIYEADQKSDYVYAINIGNHVQPKDVVVLQPNFDSFEQRSSTQLRYAGFSYLFFVVSMLVLSIALILDDDRFAAYR